MPGSGTASTSGQDKPATKGVAYGPQVFESTTDPERIFSLGNESLSIAVRAHPGNSGNIFIGFDDNVDSSNGFILEPGDNLSIDLDVDKQNLWGIPATADDEVRFIVTG